MRRSLFAGALVLLFAACNGTTGGALVTFPAYASGVQGAADFTLNGYSVHLTAAKMHIGAAYINESPIGTSAESPVCINPGIYSAQVAGPVDVDLLNPTPQPWVCGPPNCNPATAPQGGTGTADLGQSWELWLTDDTPAILAPDASQNSQAGVDSIDSLNTDHVVDLQGIATRQSDGQAFPFAAIVSINANNRGVATTDPAQPGLNPICKQRIVLMGGIAIRLTPGGALYVTVDPRPWFELETELDFASLPLTTDPACSSAPPYGDEAVPVDPLYDYGPSVCIAMTGGGCPAGTQVSALACTNAALPCEVPKRCIPNSNNAPGTVGTVAAELYKGIVSSGSAYGLTYGSPP